MMKDKTDIKRPQSIKLGEMRQSVDIPKEDLKVLVGLAQQERMRVKQYMERLIIGHAKDNK